jgi:hypothetical protein
LANSEKLGRGEKTIPDASQTGEWAAMYVIGFRLSRDPYLVVNWPIQKNLGVVRKLFWSHLN